MATDSGGELTQAVITCEGDMKDPQFPVKFGRLVQRLKTVICNESEDNRQLHVRRVEPWNSVRVTFTLPREAAIRLRQLAQVGDAALRELGILSVQLEGDQVISLTIAGRYNEPQEIIFQTEESTTSNTNGPSLLNTLLSVTAANDSSSTETLSATVNGPIIEQQSPLQGSQPVVCTEAFRSPNVVAPGSQPIPYLPPRPQPPPNPALAASGGSRPYPFASMAHAAQAMLGYNNSPLARARPVLATSSPVAVKDCSSAFPQPSSALHAVRSSPSTSTETVSSMQQQPLRTAAAAPSVAVPSSAVTPSSTATVSRGVSQVMVGSSGALLSGGTVMTSGLPLPSAASNLPATPPVSMASPLLVNLLQQQQQQLQLQQQQQQQLQQQQQPQQPVAARNSSVSFINAETSPSVSDVGPSGGPPLDKNRNRANVGRSLSHNSSPTASPYHTSPNSPAVVTTSESTNLTLAASVTVLNVRTGAPLNANALSTLAPRPAAPSELTEDQQRVVPASIPAAPLRPISIGRGVPIAQQAFRHPAQTAPPTLSRLPNPPPYPGARGAVPPVNHPRLPIILDRTTGSETSTGMTSPMTTTPSTNSSANVLDGMVCVNDTYMLPGRNNLSITVVTDPQKAAVGRIPVPVSTTTPSSVTSTPSTSSSSTTSSSTANTVTISRTSESKQLLINPLTGHLEPNPSESSDSDVESTALVQSFLGSSTSPTFLDTPLPNSVFSEGEEDAAPDEKSSPAPLAQQQQQPQVAVNTDPAAERITLRLKLEKNEPVSPAAYIIEGHPSSKNSSPSTTGPNSGSSSCANSPAAEPRVPPLHISLKGRNVTLLSSPAKEIQRKRKVRQRSDCLNEEDDVQEGLKLSYKRRRVLPLPDSDAEEEEESPVLSNSTNHAASDEQHPDADDGVREREEGAEEEEEEGPEERPEEKTNKKSDSEEPTDCRETRTSECQEKIDIQPVTLVDVQHKDAADEEKRDTPTVEAKDQSGCLWPAKIADPPESKLVRPKMNASEDLLKLSVLNNVHKNALAAMGKEQVDGITATALHVNHVKVVKDVGDIKPDVILSDLQPSREDGGNTQGEDSGIESLDALSEKSPNQSESPPRREEKEIFVVEVPPPPAPAPPPPPAVPVLVNSTPAEEAPTKAAEPSLQENCEETAASPITETPVPVEETLPPSKEALPSSPPPPPCPESPVAAQIEIPEPVELSSSTEELKETPAEEITADAAECVIPEELQPAEETEVLPLTDSSADEQQESRAAPAEVSAELPELEPMVEAVSADPIPASLGSPLPSTAESEVEQVSDAHPIASTEPTEEETVAEESQQQEEGTVPEEAHEDSAQPTQSNPAPVVSPQPEACELVGEVTICAEATETPVEEEEGGATVASPQAPPMSPSPPCVSPVEPVEDRVPTPLLVAAEESVQEPAEESMQEPAEEELVEESLEACAEELMILENNTDDVREEEVQEVPSTSPEVPAEKHPQGEPAEEKMETSAEVMEEIVVEFKEETLAELTEEMADEVKEETHAEVEEETLVEVTEEIADEVKEETAAELTEEIAEEMKEETPEEAKEEIPAEVTEEVAEEVKEETPAEMTEEVAEEMKEETQAEVKEEIAEEVKEETPTEVKKDAPAEVENETLVEEVTSSAELAETHQEEVTEAEVKETPPPAPETPQKNLPVTTPTPAAFVNSSGVFSIAAGAKVVPIKLLTLPSSAMTGNSPVKVLVSKVAHKNSPVSAVVVKSVVVPHLKASVPSSTSASASSTSDAESPREDVEELRESKVEVEDLFPNSEPQSPFHGFPSQRTTPDDLVAPVELPPPLADKNPVADALTIEIPAVPELITRCTRSGTKIISPEISRLEKKSPRQQSPLLSGTEDRPLLSNLRKNPPRRKRQESESSNASDLLSVPDTNDVGRTSPDSSVQESLISQRPSKRKCSENASELIKACMGLDDTPKRLGQDASANKRPRRGSVEEVTPIKKTDLSDEDSMGEVPNRFGRTSRSNSRLAKRAATKVVTVSKEISSTTPPPGTRRSNRHLTGVNSASAKGQSVNAENNGTTPKTAIVRRKTRSTAALAGDDSEVSFVVQNSTPAGGGGAPPSGGAGVGAGGGGATASSMPLSSSNKRRRASRDSR